MEIDPANIGGSSIVNSLQMGQGEIENVRAIYMDDLLEVISFQEAIIKIDIEGSEVQAFDHAENLFQKIKVHWIFMEWMQIRDMSNVHKKAKTRMLRLIQFLCDHHFQPHEYVDEPVLKTSLWFLWPNDIIWQNTE